MNILNVFLWLERRDRELCATGQYVIVNNALLHSNTHINQMLPQITHILHLFLVDSLLNYATDFVDNWFEAATNM